MVMSDRGLRLPGFKILSLRPLCGTLNNVNCTPFALLQRFRDEGVDTDKPSWEYRGEGIVPLEADTEPVQNINDHR